jgi:hypothetical protein
MAKTVTLCKPIRPARLKVDAVRLELLNNDRREGKAAAKALEETVMGWKGRKPKFEVLIGLTRNDTTVVVGPTGSKETVEKWNRLDEGTRGPYPIRARRAPYLRFRIGYNAGSRPGTLRTRRSYYIGNHWRRARKVTHPGIKPRGWTDIVTKRRMPKFIKSTNKALRTGMAKGGWP